ncbi:glycerophosphodiester phosphodiesterase family protein [Hyphomonas jannaschiana]|uniref:Glycerophosphoryl diester phosphodiesterase n=1 Tax=Hyphomonas jannaschiana VP2 TaxID=1280952 RepID=A0A059F7H1_9PROT|nr:glycerophosphodiester phosphodiesterase family protein [Hyphomonas jannaschiana]KCZ86521.1 glycerophosphoryl diester phosphodiesterase [Hyphomonas jannaschiana VP2]
MRKTGLTLRAVSAAALLAGCATAPPATADAPAAAEAISETFLLVADAGGMPVFFNCLRQQDAILISAHRGGPVPGYPENALETFQHTVSEIPALLEIDVQKSADGVMVLMHDDTLERTSTGEGEASHLTLAELQALTLKDNEGNATSFRIPTLDAVLDWSEGRAMFALDRKGTTTYEDLVNAVAEHDAFGRVMFATYSLDDAALVAGLSQKAMIVTPVEKLEDLQTLRVSGVNLANVLSWGGTEVPRPDFYAELEAKGVESAFATLGWWTGSWDSRIDMLNDDTLYRRITRGARLLATDRGREVAKVLPGLSAAKACTRG